jgi:phosphoribosylamine--glycine ligase
MIMADGTPKVIEYNCRFGDPETQPIMLRLQSDLVTLVEAAVDGRLDQVEAKFDPRAAVGVVLAAGGYPGPYHKGDVITGLTLGDKTAKVFHAGSKEIDGQVATNGGRVLCATALGENVTIAQKNAYQLVEKISWDGMFCRDDIAYRAIVREQN